MRNKDGVDVAVLLIFFNRPETLKLTFEQIRLAKPKKLYLAQDGDRKNNSQDKENILKCREIVENIDWDCQVFRNYSEKNNGCGLGPYYAIDWVFHFEESAIILEDDCVPSQSFFPFCEEMLERYKNDSRIFLITGCNSLLKTKDENSYFFGFSGTNWGWATWKRNWIHMDYQCSWVNNKKIFKQVKNNLEIQTTKRKSRVESKLFLKTNERLSKGENISYWDVQWQATRYLNNQLSIIPSCNLITNIGLGPMSTHAKSREIPSKLYEQEGKLHFCYNQRYELEFPLKHPDYVIRNIDYDNVIDKALYPNFIKIIIGKIVRTISKIFNFMKH